MIAIIQDFIPKTLPTRPGTKLALQFLTIHNTDNSNVGAGASAHNKYVRSSAAVARMVSWHFTVDDRAIYQHLPTDEVGFHASSKAGNGSSLGIEICMNSDMHPAKAYANAADLVARCVKLHGLKFPSCMRRHGDWTSKHCPRVLLDGKVITWDQFLTDCRSAIDAFHVEEMAEKSQSATPLEEWAPADQDSILAGIDDAMGRHGGETEETDE